MKMSGHRNHAHYWAFILHRVSGLLLAIFLPAHFYVLGLAIQGEAAMDGFIRWTDAPMVKAAEVILIILLAAHLTGGLRLMALEFFGSRESSKTAVAIGAGISLAVGLAFLINVV
jgi:fumarate reductase subunit D